MSKSKEIISEMKSIYDVLLKNSTVYFIPEFQRNFVWNSEDAEQLFNDFSEDTNDFTCDIDKLEGYLLGNIVLIEGESNVQVVDGQQRLTTLTLMAKVLDSVIKERIDKESDPKKKSNWYIKMGDLNKGYLILDDSDEFKALKLQHDSSIGFGTYYKKLIKDEEVDETDITTSSDQNISYVYDSIYSNISGLSDSQLIKFIAFFKSKIKLIVTTAPSEEKAFQLFEILNDRGRSLEPMDLIKNHFLKTLTMEGQSDEKLQEFNDDWKGVMTNLQLSSKKFIPSSSFLKQYLLAYRAINSKTENLFEFFKKNKMSGPEILQFVKGMNKTSQKYREIEKNNYSAFLQDDNMFVLFDILRIKQFHPVLMLVYDESDDNKERVLDSIVRLGAAILFSFTQTNTIEKILPAIIKKYWDVKTKNSGAEVDILIQELEDRIDEYAKQAYVLLQTKNFKGNNDMANTKVLALLRFIELYFNKNVLVKSVPKGKRITVEHIQSRNLDMTKVDLKQLGYSDEKERQEYKHRLGNLTLLFNTDNSAVGSGTYKEKEDAYRSNYFVLTSTLIEPKITTVKNGQDSKLCGRINKYEKQYSPENDNWTKELIEKRGKDLAKLIYDVLTNNV